MPTLRLLASAAALTLAAGAAPAATLLPDFFAARFVPGQAIDNPYLPLEPGARAVLRARGVDDEGEPFRERTELRVLRRQGPRILGVRATTQLDKAYEDGLLVEKTFDYFAQDSRGNVWYLGEDVTNFRYDDDGNLIGRDHESAWRGGRHGAKPGWIMPARQKIGQEYYQEFARRDEALDKGKTQAVLRRLKVGGTTYAHVLQVLETNPFEPDDREFKYYAPGVGPIRFEEGLNPQLEDPELVFNRVGGGAGTAAVAPVPVPAALPFLLAGLAALAGVARRRRTIRPSDSPASSA